MTPCSIKSALLLTGYNKAPVKTIALNREWCAIWILVDSSPLLGRIKCGRTYFCISVGLASLSVPVLDSCLNTHHDLIGLEISNVLLKLTFSKH